MHGVIEGIPGSNFSAGLRDYTQAKAWAAAMGLITETCKYSRDQLSLPECVITGQDGSTFHIIEARKVEQIKQGYDILCENLSAAEVEPFDRLTRNVQGVRLCDRPTCYRLFLAINEEGLVVAAYAGNIMDLDHRHAVFIGTYAATRQCHQRRGLITELFTSGLMQAVIDAHELNEELVLIIGDCTEASERTWNKVGRKCLYRYTADGVKEVEFLQPAIKFDLQTGFPAEGLEPVKEHLMVRSLGPDITKELIVRAVDAYYRWCGKRPPSDFETSGADPEAYFRYRAHFDGLLTQFEEGLCAGGDLVLFSAAEREAAIREGVVFV